MQGFGGPPRPRRWAALAAVALLLASGGNVRAGLIGPGMAMFQTTGSYDFSSSPIPVNTFFPGSQGFTDAVNLGGVPMAPSVLGSTDSIFGLLTSVDPAPGSTAMAQSQLVSLNLKSSQPIAIMGPGGVTSSLYNMYVALNPLAAVTSGGQATFGRDGMGNSSLQNSFFNAQVTLSFLPVNGGPGVVLPRSEMLVQKGAVPWMDGQGFVGTLSYGSTTGGLQLSFQQMSVPINPSVQTSPEPSTFVLASLGSLGALAWGWRRRKAVPA